MYVLRGNSSGLFVGDDAYIVPAEQTDFTEVYDKLATFLGPMWASAPTIADAVLCVFLGEGAESE